MGIHLWDALSRVIPLTFPSRFILHLLLFHSKFFMWMLRLWSVSYKVTGLWSPENILMERTWCFQLPRTWPLLTQHAKETGSGGIFYGLYEGGNKRGWGQLRFDCEVGRATQFLFKNKELQKKKSTILTWSIYFRERIAILDAPKQPVFYP